MISLMHLLSLSGFLLTNGVLAMRNFLLGVVTMCFLTISAFQLQAQDVQIVTGRKAVNTIYAEIFGSAGGIFGTNYSINYDRVFGDVWALRMGFSFVPRYYSTNDFQIRSSNFTIPISLSYLFNFSGSPHNIEAGIGIAPTFGWNYGESKTGNSTVFYSSGFGFTPKATGIFGYRFQPHDGGFNFRAVVTPLVLVLPWSRQPFHSVEFSGGISIGYTF